MSEWIEHRGLTCPVDGKTMVQVRIRCRTERDVEQQKPQPAEWWKRWTHNGGPGDIVAWRRS